MSSKLKKAYRHKLTLWAVGSMTTVAIILLLLAVIAISFKEFIEKWSLVHAFGTLFVAVYVSAFFIALVLIYLYCTRSQIALDFLEPSESGSGLWIPRNPPADSFLPTVSDNETRRKFSKKDKEDSESVKELKLYVAELFRKDLLRREQQSFQESTLL